MAKKRNKKYHPKEVRTPTFLYRVWPELTPGQRAELDLIPFTHLDALSKGEGTVQSAVEVMASLRHAWVLSRGFEEKYDMRMAFLLGFAAIHGESGSLRVVARVVETTGLPKVVIDFGDVKGVPLGELHKLEDFTIRVYDWMHDHLSEGELK